jgi:ketosteroid isomerase-like protein
MTDNALARWHDAILRRDVSVLDTLLADDVVFRSPVVHTPQMGKAITMKYLAAAMQVLVAENFRYTREIVGANDAALEFLVEIDGISVHGVDLLHWNERAQLTEITVMLRPLKGVQTVQSHMAAMLQSAALGGR